MHVNGQQITLADEMSLQEFLQREGYDIQKIAVEKNGDIVSKKCFQTERVTDQDKLEIVNFVGGG